LAPGLSVRRYATGKSSISAAGEWAVQQKALTALNRYGSVDDVAALAAFVAGPEASYITGATLTVDGRTNA
jgi:3-oxoacyl-[acyl-carrier protein] reductase